MTNLEKSSEDNKTIEKMWRYARIENCVLYIITFLGVFVFENMLALIFLTFVNMNKRNKEGK